MEDISAGNIIQITVIVFGIVAGFIKMKSSNEQNQQDIKQQRNEVEKLKERQNQTEINHRLSEERMKARDATQEAFQKDMTSKMNAYSSKMDYLIDLQLKKP